MDLNEAIKAHSEWKMKLRSAIQAHSTLDVAAIGRDDGCVLGKWLHGESRNQYGMLKSHKECVRHHAEFHKQASQVAAAINAGKYTQAETMLGSGTPYMSASQAVVMAIGTLKREAGI